MYIIGGIICFLVYLFVSIIDLDYLINTETIKISFKNIKKNYNLIHLIIISITNFYFIIIFSTNTILYFINLLCFLCLYICSFTDIFIKYIFLNIVIVFFIPIIILNFFANYFEISILGFLSGIIFYGLIYGVSKIVYGKESFGIGDIYMLSLIGISSDWYTVLYIGLLTFVIAGIFYFTKFLIIGDLKSFKEQEIPLVPFILCSYLIIIYF